MKNCGNRFHTLAASKDVLGDLVKILTSKVSFCACFYCMQNLKAEGRRERDRPNIILKETANNKASKMGLREGKSWM